MSMRAHAFEAVENGAAVSTPLTRLERRAALDVSIDDELLRGELRGAELSAAHREILAELVEHELSGRGPVSERKLARSRGWGGLFGGMRRARGVEALLGMTLARRVGDDVRPTVAGIAAIRRISELPPSEHPPRDLLRFLRRAEIGSIRR